MGHFRRSDYGARLGIRRRIDGNHHHRTALGTRLLSHRALHTLAFRLSSRSARTAYCGGSCGLLGQYHLADIGRLVAGIRTSDTGNRLFHQHHRHTLRLAARQNAAHLPRPHRYENRSHIRAKLGKQHNATALVRHRG